MNKVRMTGAQLQQHIMQNWRNGIVYAVENNPSAAFQWIRNRLPNSGLPNWGNGFEAAPANMQRMQNILIAAAAQSSNPSQFTQGFMLQIPYNDNAVNWTKQL